MRILITLLLCIAIIFADQSPKEELIVVLKDASYRHALESHVFTLQSVLNINPILPEILPPDAPKGIVQELLKYFHVIPSQEASLLSVKEHLKTLEFVETAYIKPAPSLAVLPEEEISKTKRNTSKTPLFVSRQIYLSDAPAGVNQKAVWDVPGGRGDGVTVVDIEGGWDFDHEDLIQHKGRTLFGVNSDQSAYKDHGSAVLGVIAGYNNEFGVTGIAPNTQIHGASVFTEKGMLYPSFGKLVIDVANYLKKGDIILIELHAPGPRCDFKNCGGQKGYIAMEYWPDNFLAFKYATEKGIIVIEAAGNGYENLDDPIYSKRPKDFPSDWKNPFNRSIADSGAIVVGAGAPPPGTHGANHGPDRSRLDFSNYGTVIDAQGWGREVTTLGYGDLQSGKRQVLYTDRFSGTSSASPVVVGSVACIQGIAKKRGRVLTSQEARDLLRNSGSPQQDAPGRPKTQRIGNRPDMGEMLKLLDKM